MVPLGLLRAVELDVCPFPPQSLLYLDLLVERPQAEWTLLFPLTCIIIITEFIGTLDTGEKHVPDDC